MPKSDKLLGKQIPYVQASNVGAKQKPTAIVLRTSFTTSDFGAALGIAMAWHSPSNLDSCHYVIDELQAFRCISDNIMSSSISTVDVNRRAITINLCYDPPELPSEQLVYRTSKHVARLCRLHRIKLRVLDSQQKHRWIEHPWRSRGGIIIDTSGGFPTNEFLSSVKEEHKKFD